MKNHKPEGKTRRLPENTIKRQGKPGRREDVELNAVTVGNNGIETRGAAGSVDASTLETGSSPMARQQDGQSQGETGSDAIDDDTGSNNGFRDILSGLYETASSPKFMARPDEERLALSDADAFHRPQAVSAINKNLSEIIKTIQDDGPSPCVTETLRSEHEVHTASAESAGGIAPERVPRNVSCRHDMTESNSSTHDSPAERSAIGSRNPPRLATRVMTYARTVQSRIVTGLAIIAALLGFLLFAWGQFLGKPRSDLTMNVTSGTQQYIQRVNEPMVTSTAELPSTAVTVSGTAGEAGLEEIRERQLQILSRQEELAAGMANIQDNNSKRWATYEAILNEIREEQRNEIKAISVMLATLQKQLHELEASGTVAGKPKKKSSDEQSGGSAQPRGEGEWVVYLASSGNKEAIGKLVAKLQKSGIAAEQQEIDTDGVKRYRLRVVGFTSSAEAQEYAGKLKQDRNFAGAYVSKN
jgi:hypothetical protein